MSHCPLTPAEVENKVAFLVQLHALLTQVNAVVGSSALGSAQKAKLSDIRTTTEAWLKDVGVVGTPRPSIAAAAQPPPSPQQQQQQQQQSPSPDVATGVQAAAADEPAAPESAAADVSALQEGALAAAVEPAPEQAETQPIVVAADLESTHPSAGTPTAATAAAASAATGDAHARAPPSPAVSGASSSFTAAVGATPELAEGRSVVDLVRYVRLLLNSDMPERVKLQAFGKSLVRLLMVRCCSTITASLQHVVHHTYTSDAAAEADAVTATATTLRLVHLAAEVRTATAALLGCVQVVTANAVLSDAASARFPVQLCVDVLRQVRRAQVYFSSRVEKEELYLLRASLLSTGSATARPTDAACEDVDAAQDVFDDVSPERLAAHVQGRVEALRRLWGPSLTHSIRSIGAVVEPAIRFLAAVAAVRAEGAPAPLVALKKDAANDLFLLCGPATTSAGGPSALAKPSSTGDLAAPVASPVSVNSTPPLWRATAGEVLARLGSSFTADYLAAVAGCCGDSNDGQLLATRLLSDMLQHLAAHELPLLRSLLLDVRWCRPLYDGILSCVVSIQPAVLAAGLDTLGLLTTACPMVVGAEVGFLYGNVVLRLLESATCPHYVKRTIVLHFITVLLGNSNSNGSGGAVVPTDSGSGTAPLLLHLYRLYDMNVHAHQLNLVQQLTSALSRIVRTAPKEDLAQDAVVQEQLQLQQEAAAADGTAAAAAAPPLASLSLPAMALHGLVRIVEVIASQIPPEDESGGDALAALPSMTCREAKLKEQQDVDRINAAPKKAIYAYFGITEEDNTVPATHEGFSAQWEHALLPPPVSAAAAAKVEAVVDLLTHVGSLSPEAVAEFLTTPALFPLQVCAAYMRRLPLAGCGVLEAISELLMRVQLPKEGQRIERLLEYFAAAYFAANCGRGIDRDTFPFKDDTAVFIVVVATVMLNTNIHNPSAGMRLDLSAFRGQLRRCNADGNFADAFVDDIFHSISAHPLESIKASASASGTGVTDATGTGDGSANVSRGGGAFDIFFVSQEERRQLAFGVERQRMVCETRQLLQLRTERAALGPVAAGWWCAVAKDLYLSTWSSVCAVFGPAMYDGASAAPRHVLLQCVRGLQSLLCTAAAFDLPTECTVTLLTLLRMAEETPVRAQCRRAVLVVAATTYAANLPVRCWVAVCQLLLEVRRTAAAATPPLVEDVFTRIEGITRLSVEAEERRAASGAAAGAEKDRATAAIHRALEGIMTTLHGYAVGDVSNVSAALAVLRRALEYTRIVHARRTTDVVYFVNVRDFTHVVMPAYVELMKKHSGSDDGLQALSDCLVDLLCTMWLSYSARRVRAPAAAPATAAVAVTVDTAPADFVQCFRCLRSVYDVTLASAAADGAATLLQMHTLQAAKEVLCRTVRATEITSAGQHLSLYTMLASWQEVLYPLAMALCDRTSTAPEAGSLALLVLRKLVALCGGTGGTSTDRLPAPVRGALLWLLAQIAYMGGMCGDVDSAQVCVTLLSGICTATVATAAAATSSSTAAAAGGWGAASPASPAAAALDGDAFLRLLEQRNAATQQVVASIEAVPGFVAQRTVLRLCLLLRCDREQTRSEAVHQLRTLSLQMRPAQLCAAALDLAEVVLEGVIGHAAQHHKTPITHSSLLPFLVLQVPVPASMRRCSRSSFRSTVPAALNFMAAELLACLRGDDMTTAARTIMQRCLLPILLSASSPYQCRFLAARCLSQCIAVCLPQLRAPPSPPLAQCVLDTLAMALYAVQVPLDAVVPPTANFVGRRWHDPPATHAAADWATYTAEAREVVRLVGSAEPVVLVRGAAAVEAAEAVVGGWTPAAAAAAADDSSSGGVSATPGRGGRDGREDAARRVVALLSDEALVERVNLLAQTLAGVSKDLQEVVVVAARAADDDAPPRTAGVEDWELPRCTVRVLLHLMLQAAGTLVAVLWRINHPYEVEQHALQSAERGREAPAAFTRNSGLLPHAAIRSVLQCYLELTSLCADYPAEELLAAATDVISAVRQVQAATHSAAPSSSPPPSLELHSADAAATLLAADAVSLQGLPPQDQQHVRTCNSGMYQQLTIVLGHLVRLLTGQTAAAAVTAMALHPHFFSSLTSLLTPTAGTLIITVRDYLVWYIAHVPLPPPPPALPKVAEHARPAETETAAANRCLHSNGSSNGVHGSETSKLTQARAALTPLLKTSTAEALPSPAAAAAPAAAAVVVDSHDDDDDTLL